MRKIALFLALCLSLSLLGGCAGSGSTTGAPPTSTPEVVSSDAGGSTENDPLFSGDLEDYDFSAPEDTNAFDLPLLYAQPFSDGYAWVQYEDEADNIVTSVIDTNGTICFSLPTGVEPSYMSPFADGYSYYRVGDAYETSYEVIVDTTGNECYRTSNSDGAKSWEHIFGQANGLFAIYLQETGMEAVTHTISMTQADGTTVSSFSDFGSEPPFGEYPLKYSDTFTYLGEGWYQFDGWAQNYLNFDQQRIAYSSQVGILSYFRDGKTLSDSSSKGFTFLDANLNYIEDYPLASVSYLDKDADGGMWWLEIKLNNGFSNDYKTHPVINAIQLWQQNDPTARQTALTLLAFQLQKWMGFHGKSNNYYYSDEVCSNLASWRLLLRNILAELCADSTMTTMDNLTYGAWYSANKGNVVTVINRHLSSIGKTLPEMTIRTPKWTAKQPICQAKLAEEDQLRVETIHSVKGGTFDAVLLLSSPDARGKTGFWENWLKSNEESGRIGYVASTRSRYLLCWGVSNLASEQRHQLEGMGFVKLDS